MRFRQTIALVSAAALALEGCGGGGGGSTSTTPVVTPPPPGSTNAYAVPAQEALSVADVQRVLAQAVTEAQAQSLPSIIAVVDRVGNVLGVFTMQGANPRLAVPSSPSGRDFDIQGLSIIPAAGGAIAKAITGAYLSSGGNAFSSRTASQIIQQHFPPSPTTPGLESGPLFGVQFSSLPCSDLNTRGFANMLGPKRSPLGLSADAGGLPLYKNGVLVGGIGVMGDALYAFDPSVIDTDYDREEHIALAGTIGFDAPEDIRANRINVDGTSLRYSDAVPAGLRASTPAPALSTLIGTAGGVVAVRSYFNGTILAGAPYGSEGSGYRAATVAEFSNRDAFVLTDGAGNLRYPIRGGTDGTVTASPLTAAESRAILEEAFLIMTRARAQIRRPLDSRAQVTISLVDTFGAIMGIVRAPDAPVFGTDVSLQKARTVSFFSNPLAASQLEANTSTDVISFVAATRTFLSDPTALTGRTAFSNRAIGNLARPYFPDGEVGRPKGPLSRDIDNFNPFSTGLQSALIFQNLGQHVSFLSQATAIDTPVGCTQTPPVATGLNRLNNGLQIFPGGVPIYRNGTLIGALGISGDGIDQDDMISFLGVHNAGVRLGTFGNAPADRRADQIVVNLTNGNARLRWVNCPFAAFLDTAEQNVCQGR